MGPYLSKAGIMLMRSSEQGKRYYFKSNFFSLKQYLCEMLLPRLHKNEKDEEAALILI